MRYRELTLGLFAAVLAAGLAPACGGSDDEAAVLATGGKGGKDAGTGGKDAGTDASSEGSAGTAGSSGASGGGGTAGGGDGGTAGSASGGSAGAAGAGGGKPDGGNTGGADAGKCPDPLNEPNETENAAAKVGNACDGSHTIDGILVGKELDWYTYLAPDTLLTCTPNPTVKTDQPTLRACVFATCVSGTTPVTCAQGSAATSPAGRSGCCSTGGTAEIAVNCASLTNKNANVFMRIDQPAGDACLAYKLTYSN